MGIKDEELEGLSDEERAALEDDEDEATILKSVAGDDDDDEEQSNDAGSADDPAAADDGAKVVAAADDPAATGNTEQSEASGQDAVADTSSPAEFQPEFKAAVPDGLADKIASLNTRTDELMAKFKDGEIEMPEFLKQTRAIDDERLQLTLAQKQAEWAQSQNEDTRAQRWQWEQERFFAQEKAGIYKDPIVLAALDASVKQLTTDPANAKKPSSFFLEEADRQVRQRFNMGGTPAADAGGKPKPGVKQPDLSAVPKTLANLPAAEMAETGSDEFAYLDKLDGIALEQALRKMTPEQEARYLGAA
jgi:hypothetical protein